MITQEEAISKIKTVTGFDFSSKFLSMEISKDIVNSLDIKNTFNSSIFSDDQMGWFIWIDPCNIVDWSHNCYYFLINDQIYLSAQNGWYPKDNVELKKIK